MSGQIARFPIQVREIASTIGSEDRELCLEIDLFGAVGAGAGIPNLSSCPSP
jgi:hypothetical protein